MHVAYEVLYDFSQVQHDALPQRFGLLDGNLARHRTGHEHQPRCPDRRRRRDRVHPRTAHELHGRFPQPDRGNGRILVPLLPRLSRNDAVRCAIEQLPVIFREVILLCDVEDASYREIAEILSIPIGTVMSRLARARKVVRESLRSNPRAPLSRDSSHHLEPHEEVLERNARSNSEVCLD